MKYPTIHVTGTKNAAAHSYPFQICLETLETTQANLFYLIFADTAAGLQVRREGGMAEIEEKIQKNGASDSELHQGLSLFQKYEEILKSSNRMRFLTEMVIHWEWFLKKMQSFMKSNSSIIQQELLDKKTKENLDRLIFRDVREQITTIKKLTGNLFTTEVSDENVLYEMFLLRNLGQHSRWECDEKYIKLSSQGKKWKLGHVRLIDYTELKDMHEVLGKIIREIAQAIAIKFTSAPGYPPP